MAATGSLQRGLALLVALGKYPGGVGSSLLAREAGIPVSSVHRVLRTLIDHHFVRYDARTRTYELGIKIFELSHFVPTIRSLIELAASPLRKLAKETGESSLLAIRDGREMVYINHTAGWQSIQIRGSVGDRGPLHCTAMGKTLLAFLPEPERDALVKGLDLKAFTPHTITDYEQLRQELIRVREQGYATADEEHELQIRAMGMPVFDSSQQIVAALAVAGPVFRVKIEDLERYLPLLRDAASEIGTRFRSI
jgi:IclR family transcriptional regulator, acetate operon repressor